MKSEESHRMSAENIRLSDNKYDNSLNSLEKTHFPTASTSFKSWKNWKLGNQQVLFFKMLVSAKINQKLSKPTMTEVKSSRVNKQNFDW